MLARALRIYALAKPNKDQVAAYESFLYPDEEAQEGACTAMAIMCAAQVCAGLMCGLVLNHIRGEKPAQEMAKEVMVDLVDPSITVSDL